MSEPVKRLNKCVNLDFDLVIVGGGLSGVCCAITAARLNIKVALIQDRPVLGGNASSEVRVWALGATSHMGNNNRWAREGGVIDEILVENMYRNKEGNPLIFDTILMEKVLNETKISLFLNTCVIDVVMSSAETLSMVIAFNAQNSTAYNISGKYFCDASGDGIVGYLSGANYHIGTEEELELDEEYLPKNDYGEVLGHTIFYYTKKSENPVRYIAPSFALKDLSMLPKIHQVSPDQQGCNYWWFEYGGTKDTIYDTEEIKFELWKVIFGVWDHIKNSGKFPDVENVTLEWVGTIPGKRESRRFMGLYMLNKYDFLEQNQFDDSVSYGGWAIDLHPANGVYSSLPSCNQYHSKGIYSIPYRCFVSRDINNLFFAGRLISVSHVVFGSTRVMITCAHGGQVVGAAAAMCVKQQCLPADLLTGNHMAKLQQLLNFNGQSIPHVPMNQKYNIASEAKITTSSTLRFDGFAFDGEWQNLDMHISELLPLKAGLKYSFEVELKADKDTNLTVELMASSKPFNYTPDCLIQKKIVKVNKGMGRLNVKFDSDIPASQYCFIIFRANPLISIRGSLQRVSGITSAYNQRNEKVNNLGMQIPPINSGFESFEFFTPERRPKGYNIAMKVSPALECFEAKSLVNGYVRPYITPNLWVADWNDKNPEITFQWDKEVEIKTVKLFFDTDLDHPMESVQWGHPEDIMPFCVDKYSIYNDKGDLVYSVEDNHQTINTLTFEKDLITSSLRIVLQNSKHPQIPVSLFEIELR